MDIQTKTQKLTDIQNSLTALASVSDSWANTTNTSVLDFKTIGGDTSHTLGINLPKTERIRWLTKQTVSQTELVLKISNIDGQYRRLKYCLTEQEKVRNSLKDLSFAIKRLVIQNQETLGNITLDQTKLDGFQAEYAQWVALDSPTTTLNGQTRLGADIQKDIISTQRDLAQNKLNDQEESSNLVGAKEDYEARLKELALYQQIYSEMLTGLKISENWTEADFEQAEFGCLIVEAYKQAIKEVTASSVGGQPGNISQDTIDKLHTLNIDDVEAVSLVKRYLTSLQPTASTNGSTSSNTSSSSNPTTPPDTRYNKPLTTEEKATLPKDTSTSVPWGNFSFFSWVAGNYDDNRAKAMSSAGITSLVGPMLFKQTA